MMTKHSIAEEWDEIPDGADELSMVQGAFRSYRCSCGLPLPDRVAAELHAMEANQCSGCLGSAHTEIVPGFVRRCPACAGTGRRGQQLVWELAYSQAEETITIALVRSLLNRFTGPFRLSEMADAVRAALSLPVGRLPVGPRVRDLLRELEVAGDLVMISAPDRLLHGTAVVLYRDPQWVRATTGPGV
jgi:hypothetical protein